MKTQKELSKSINVLRENILLKSENKNYIEKLFNKILNKYLALIGENFIDTHIFYFKENKVKLLDFYYPLKCFKEEKEIYFSSPIQELNSDNFILIEGGAGFGKSTIMKYTFLNCLKEAEKIPIFISLHELNDFISNQSIEVRHDINNVLTNTANFSIKNLGDTNIIEKFLYNKILRFNNYNLENESFIKFALNNGLFLLIFDGFDEIVSSSHMKVQNDLESFQYIYPKNHCIITSRPGSKLNRIGVIKRFRVDTLSYDDVFKFINLLNPKNPSRSNKIKQSLKSSSSIHYKALLKNPLLLSMFVLTYEHYPEIPKKRSEFYGNVFNTLYGIHKTRQGLTSIERKSKLDRSLYEKVLSAISYIFYMKNMYTLDEISLVGALTRVNNENILKVDFKEEDLLYDLTTSISILIIDGNEIHYPHRSIQEYFTALFISSLHIDSDKSRAYERLRNEKITKITDNLSNLYDLLVELDPYGVKKYFAIDAISEFLNFFKDEFGPDQITAFIDTFDFYITINDEGEFSENFLRITISRDVNPIIKALEHFSYKTSLSKLDENIEILQLEQEIADLLENDSSLYTKVFYTEGYSLKPREVSYSLIEFSQKDTELYDVIYSHFDMVDINETILSKLENDITRIEKEIIETNSGNSSIIDD
jgi:archaellum biogenesis ATPase FlaH